MDVEWELRARQAVFLWLDDLQHQYPDALPARALQTGIMVEGKQIRVLGSGPGIFKPASLDAAVSLMTTAPKPGRSMPYEDVWIDDARLSYAYEGVDISSHRNAAMRRAWEHGLPLVYLHGVFTGRYLAEYPVYVSGDRPADLRVDLVIGARPGERGIAIELDGRSYATRPARMRLHQREFRARVIRAYSGSCSICSLRHVTLLDAAHIVPDTEPQGAAVTRNGMSLCKIHHAAYDQSLIGVRPDHVVEVNQALLEEIDGPMLRHGLQDFHGKKLRVLPRSATDKPDPVRLEWRYERFRNATA